MMTDQLKYHLERQEDLEACCQLLSDMLEVLYRRDVVSEGCGPGLALTRTRLGTEARGLFPEAMALILRVIFSL